MTLLWSSPQGHLLGTLDPNPRHQPPQPSWQIPVYQAEASVRDDAADGTGEDTFTVTDRWYNDHIASVRVYDDDSYDDPIGEVGFDDVVVNVVVSPSEYMNRRGSCASDGGGSVGSDHGSVYITQLLGTGAGSPKTKPRLVVNTAEDTPREITAVELASPKKRVKKIVLKELDRIPGYSGLVMGADVRVVLLSHRKAALAALGRAYGLPTAVGKPVDPLDKPGLKHAGLAPKRGRVVWHWQPDLETRYVKNVAEAKEVLGLGRVMALAAKWRTKAAENAPEKP